MSFPICATCGTQYETAGGVPAQCPICSDDRQYVGWDGQHWTTLSELAQRHGVRLEQEAGMLAIGMAPAFAIDQRAFVLPTASRRIMWECVSLVTKEAIADIEARGGQLFPGDALQVVFDRRHVTFMYSYPNYIPLHPDAVRTMQRRLAGYEFDDIFGYTLGRNIIGDARAAVDRSFDRYLRAVGAAAA